LLEEHVEITAWRGWEERCTAVLPAWSAHSTHQLTDPQLRFATVRHAPDSIDPWHARQAVLARHTRLGFEARAVTALGVNLSADYERPGIRRTAGLRFGHPFAVVAVGVAEDRYSLRPVPHNPWHGLVVFSAWVADPEEATTEPDGAS
jgi:hypothetical protein